jgi:Zn-dependent oligopeptidase
VFGDTLVNSPVGRRFRRDILSRGAQEPAAVLVERFLGRPVKADAFFKEIVGAARA